MAVYWAQKSSYCRRGLRCPRPLMNKPKVYVESFDINYFIVPVTVSILNFQAFISKIDL